MVEVFDGAEAKYVSVVHGLVEGVLFYGLLTSFDMDFEVVFAVEVVVLVVDDVGVGR